VNFHLKSDPSVQNSLDMFDLSTCIMSHENVVGLVEVIVGCLGEPHLFKQRGLLS